MANINMSGIIEKVEQKQGAKGIFNKLTIDRKMYNYFQETLPTGIKVGTAVDIEYSESPYKTPDGKDVTSRSIWKLVPSSSATATTQAQPSQQSKPATSNDNSHWDIKNKLEAQKLEFDKYKLKVMTNLGVLRDAVQFLEMKLKNEELLGVGKAKPLSVDDVYALAAEFQARINGTDPWGVTSNQAKPSLPKPAQKGVHPDDDDGPEPVTVEDVVD